MVFRPVQRVACDATVSRVKSPPRLDAGFGDLDVRFLESMMSLGGIGAKQNLQLSRFGFKNLE